MVGSNLRTGAIDDAIVGRRESGIATNVRRRRSVERREASCGIELWKAVEGAIGEPIRLPVGSQRAEVVIQTAILLGHKDNVIQHFHGLIDVEGRGYRLVRIHRHGAGSGALAGSGPAGKEGSLAGSRGELNAGSGAERRATRRSAADTRRAAGDGSGGSPGQLDGKLEGGGRSGRDASLTRLRCGR